MHGEPVSSKTLAGGDVQAVLRGVERRVIARKLLDLGDAKSAYAVANMTGTLSNENHRSEQQFTAGWIALRFLREPTVALGHFAHIADGATNPITLARS